MPVAQAQGLVLPKPGSMVYLTPSLNPVILKGIKIYPKDPLKFDFIVDPGDQDFVGNGPASPAGGREGSLREESTKLIKYFLAALTVPEKDLWVNLSPYEKDRIVPDGFGVTEVGRDLLAQDYILKQLTASLIYPENSLGKKFWDKVYRQAKEIYGTTEIPVNTFNKVWVVPSEAGVYKTKDGAFVTKARLKVMLEEDYLSLEKHNSPPFMGGVRGGLTQRNAPLLNPPHKGEETNSLGSQIVREVVIPELEKEVNEGENFVQLRQVYNSLILATWFKRNLKNSIYSQYIGHNKTSGVDITDKTQKQKIYEQYLEAYKKGVFNYIKEDVDVITQQRIPRKYFSGGAELTGLAMKVYEESSNPAMASSVGLTPKNFVMTVVLKTSGADNAMLGTGIRNALLTLGLMGGDAIGNYAPPAINLDLIDAGWAIQDPQVTQLTAKTDPVEQKARKALQEYLKDVMNSRISIPNNSNMDFWRNMFSEASKELKNPPQYFKELIDSEDTLERFIELFFEAFNKVVSKESPYINNEGNLRKIQELIDGSWESKTWRNEGGETRKYRRFFQNEWTEFIVAVGNQLPESEKAGSSLVEKASKINLKMAAMMQEIVSLAKNFNNKEKIKEVLDRWIKFNEEILIPANFYGTLNVITENVGQKNGSVNYSSVIYKIDRKETKRIQGDYEIVILYSTKIDQTNIYSSVLGHSVTGEKVVFINSAEILEKLQQIKKVMDGGHQVLLPGADANSPYVDELVRSLYKGMSDEEIVRFIEASTVRHELTHKAQELNGVVYALDDRFGIDERLWNRIDQQSKKSLDQETAAYLAQLITSEHPESVLLHLLPHLLSNRPTPEHFVARYIYNSLNGTELKDWVDFRNANSVIGILLKLSKDPQLKTRANALFEKAFPKLNLPDQAMRADSAMLSKKNKIAILAAMMGALGTAAGLVFLDEASPELINPPALTFAPQVAPAPLESASTDQIAQPTRIQLTPEALAKEKYGVDLRPTVADLQEAIRRSQANLDDLIHKMYSKEYEENFVYTKKDKDGKSIVTDTRPDAIQGVRKEIQEFREIVDKAIARGNVAADQDRFGPQRVHLFSMRIGLFQLQERYGAQQPSAIKFWADPLEREIHEIEGVLAKQIKSLDKAMLAINQQIKLRNGAQLLGALTPEQWGRRSAELFEGAEIVVSPDGKIQFKPTNYTDWGTDLNRLSKNLGINILDHVIALAKAHRTRKVRILDWGFGNGTSLNELAVALRKAGIRNVELYGLSHAYSNNWNNLDPSIKVIFDRAENIEKYFSSDSVDFIYSRMALRHYLTDINVSDYLGKRLKNLLRVQGRIVTDVRDIRWLDRLNFDGFPKVGVYSPNIMYFEKTEDQMIKVGSKSDQSRPASLSKDLGGIDLNPTDLKIDEKGQDLAMPQIGVNSISLDQNFNGFTPVIINIVPVTNILELLGINSLSK